MSKPTTTKSNTPSAFQSKAPASDKPLAVIEARVLTPKLARDYARLRANDNLHFSQEKEFFLAQVKRNKDLQRAIPDSLAEAFRQAASIGLSFNPLLGHVYLIPRKARRNDPEAPIIAYASPGYRGLIHLAILGGAIKWARAEVVYERDHFRYFGPTKEPEFIAGGASSVNSLMVKRGAKVGVFCHAKTVDGDDLCDMMDAAAVARIRNKSEMPDSLMWTTFEEEGWKKAILRRASKTWPHTANAAVFQRAVEILNDNEGLAIPGEELPEVQRVIDPEQINQLHSMLIESGAASEVAADWLKKLAKLFGCAEIKDLPIDRFEDARSRLREKIDESKKKGGGHAPAA